MKTYECGETAVCYCEVRKSNALYDPANSMQITIYKPDSTAETIAAMTKDAVGKYSYDYQTASKPNGKYKVLYTCTDGTKMTTAKDYFMLEPV